MYASLRTTVVSIGNRNRAERNTTPLTEAERDRYDRVTVAFVRAVNTGDRKAYRALLTDDGWESSIPWFKDMFRVQINKFGFVETVYATTHAVHHFGGRGVGAEHMDGDAFAVDSEDPFGGVLAIELDKENQNYSHLGVSIQPAFCTRH